MNAYDIQARIAEWAGSHWLHWSMFTRYGRLARSCGRET